MTYQFPKAIDLKNMSSKARAAVDWSAGILQSKYDGCAVVAKRQRIGDTVRWVPYTGSDKLVLSMTEQMDALPALPLGSVLVGEAWRKGYSFQAISGEFRRHRQSALEFVVFDGHVAEEAANPYFERADSLRCEGVKVINHISAVSEAFAWHFARTAVAVGGYDGAIWRNPLAPFRTGRSVGDVIKLKPLVDHDLECIGFDVGTGEKTGRATVALICKWRAGELQEVATGLSHAEQADPDQFVGRIIRVAGMGYTEAGKLREPRFGGVSDKDTPDF